jgi:hypothetical protein
MRVAVLCGGKGTRLGEPIKCLTEVAGRPFMDYKLDQLRFQGAHQIHLICGPFINDFIERYSNDPSLTFSTDPQLGILPALQAVHPAQWWTMGDVLCDFGQFWTPGTSTMLVQRGLPNPNIAGIYLDCGFYFGKANFTMVEVSEGVVPLTINTREDLERTDEALRRYCQPV